MNEIETLIGQHKFIRDRTLKILDDIATSDNPEALYWMMPFGIPGRAHIAWQMMHCAATLDRYLNVRILKRSPVDSILVERYAGGSTPDPELKPNPDEIKKTLSITLKPYADFMLGLGEEKLDDIPDESQGRSYRDVLYLLNWHEAHHHGQCQIIWNSFKEKHRNL